MRLLMTTDTVGGVWTFSKELTSGLLLSGCEVLLVSLGRLPSTDQLAEMDALKNGGRFHYVAIDSSLEWMPENHEAYTAAEPELLQLCRDFAPEALLLSQFCLGALKVPVKKLVITHSDVLSWAEAVGKAPLADDAWLQKYRTLVQTGLNGTDVVIAPTRAALVGTASHFHLPAASAVIPNGRDVVIGDEDKALQAITAGRMWDPAKNLRMLDTLRSPMPIFVAGEHAGEGSKNPGVRFVGVQSQNNMLRLFQQSAVYMCCSLYEPFGLAPLEAALCGCAVLAQDIPSLREVWEESALYFTDTGSARTLLNELADDAGRLRQMQAASLGRARQFSRKRMTESYLALLNRAVAAKPESQAHAA